MLQIIHIREVYYLSLLCAIKGKPVNGRQNSSLIEERKKNRSRKWDSDKNTSIKDRDSSSSATIRRLHQKEISKMK